MSLVVFNIKRKNVGVMIEIKSDKSKLTASQINDQKLKISILENSILERNICLNKKQVNDLINYLTVRKKEMKS